MYKRQFKKRRKAKERAVCAWYDEYEGKDYQLGTNKEVFDAELFAIYRGVRKATKLQSQTTKKVTILSDSPSALQRIQTDDESPGQAMARGI